MKRPKNRYKRALLYKIEDVDFVTCPYCGKKMQFLHWKHLSNHGKTIKDVNIEFPELITMTKKEHEKRSEKRKKCNKKIIETCNKKYGGVGFASKKLGNKSRLVIEERYGHRNIMKTSHGKKYFLGELNPMKDLKTAKKVSRTVKKKIKENGHWLKGKTYEEILGKDRAKRRKKELKKSGAYGQSITPRISAPQLQLYKMVKEKYSTAILEYPLGDFCIDVAVPEEKLAFEYDGSYWHDPEKDSIRDSILERLGWKVFRFVDKLPSNL